MSLFKKKKLLVTHNGTFHSDDLFATATLSILYGGNIKVIRTRDPELIEKADVVYDVGGINNPENDRFDHHQKEGGGIRPNGIPYSSFGLIWKAYGELISGDKEVADRIDQKVVEPIDARDNGLDISRPIYEGIIPYEADQVFLNHKPTWNEDNEDIDSIFMEQVKKVKELLLREIEVTRANVVGKNIILNTYIKSPNRQIIILEKDFPRYLYQDTLSKLREPVYVVFPSGHSDMWKVEAIRKSPDTMENRKPFPENWRGYTNEDPKLIEATGVSDVSFCHRGGFLAIVHSREGAIKLAEKALLA